MLWLNSAWYFCKCVYSDQCFVLLGSHRDFLYKSSGLVGTWCSYIWDVSRRGEWMIDDLTMYCYPVEIVTFTSVSFRCGLFYWVCVSSRGGKGLIWTVCQQIAWATQKDMGKVYKVQQGLKCVLVKLSQQNSFCSVCMILNSSVPEKGFFKKGKILNFAYSSK